MLEKLKNAMRWRGDLAEARNRTKAMRMRGTGPAQRDRTRYDRLSQHDDQWQGSGG